MGSQLSLGLLSVFGATSSFWLPVCLGLPSSSLWPFFCVGPLFVGVSWTPDCALALPVSWSHFCFLAYVMSLGSLASPDSCRLDSFLSLGSSSCLLAFLSFGHLSGSWSLPVSWPPFCISVPSCPLAFYFCLLVSFHLLASCLSLRLLSVFRPPFNSVSWLPLISWPPVGLLIPSCLSTDLLSVSGLPINSVSWPPFISRPPVCLIVPSCALASFVSVGFLCVPWPPLISWPPFCLLVSSCPLASFLSLGLLSLGILSSFGFLSVPWLPFLFRSRSTTDSVATLQVTLKCWNFLFVKCVALAVGSFSQRPQSGCC